MTREARPGNRQDLADMYITDRYIGGKSMQRSLAPW